MLSVELKGKAAVVVGGTRGIGLAAAAALARAGASVAVSGRSTETATQVAAELSSSHGVPTLGLGWDIADAEAADPAIEAVLARFEHLDSCVVAAGINPYWSRALDVTSEIWDEEMATNLRGAFFAARAAARPMLESPAGGAILLTSSVTASSGVSRGLPYVATKGGLEAMVRSLAVEWADASVRVNAISPGFVETDLTAGVREHDEIRESILARIPMGRFGTPAEIGDLAAALVSDLTSYVTGQVIQIDGGYAAA
jgi:NAD(P)-dependent dehydrogenase (short-subunit alcohol dehydrogenase family)